MFVHFTGIFTPKRSRSSAWTAARASASRGLWPCTRSCTWKTLPTNVPRVVGASTRGATWRLICWHTRTSSRTTVPIAERCSEGTVISEGIPLATAWTRRVAKSSLAQTHLPSTWSYHSRLFSPGAPHLYIPTPFLSLQVIVLFNSFFHNAFHLMPFLKIQDF